MIKNSDQALTDWTLTATWAAEKAKILRPISEVLLVVALGLITSEYFVQPTWAELKNAPRLTWWQGLSEWLLHLVEAGAAIALVWALWETKSYLHRLEKGAVWSVSTITFLERIGECLIASAVWKTLIAPTIDFWMSGHGGFKWHLESSSLVLFGLGLLMALIAQVFARTLNTANQLKTENEEIV
jgi:Protein of unknown function (DUF2975)